MSAAEAAVGRGRARAEALMVDACTIAAAPLRSGESSSTPGATRYSGKCRLQEVAAPAANPGPLETEERPAWQAQQVIVSVPASVTGVQVGDEVLVTASQLDPEAVGRRLRVVALTAKTHLTARRLTCNEVTAMAFATDEVTVVAPGTATDPYSNVLPDWSSGAVTRTTVRGSVQPLPGDETTAGDSQRSQVRDRYRVWLPAGTAVTAASRLEWLDLVLDVEGDPRVHADGVTPLPLEVTAYRVTG